LCDMLFDSHRAHRVHRGVLLIEVRRRMPAISRCHFSHAEGRRRGGTPTSLHGATGAVQSPYRHAMTLGW
jgi:hypothetical protein